MFLTDGPQPCVRQYRTAHVMAVNSNQELKCVGCVVFDLQIQPALGHRRVDPLGNTGHIEMEVDPVGMLFRDSQRGMRMPSL